MDKLLEGSLWYPAEFGLGLGWITQKRLDFCGAVIFLRYRHEHFSFLINTLLFRTFPTELDWPTYHFEAQRNQIAHAILHTRSYDEIFRFLCLKHHPHLF